MKLDDYEQDLLQAWEEVFKKGQLTLWVLLSLKAGPKHMAEIKDYIQTATNDTLSADDQSMYRALRRYYDAEMVTYTTEPGHNGPDRKVYALTETGVKILSSFVERNIAGVYFKPENQTLLGGRHVKKLH